MARPSVDDVTETGATTARDGEHLILGATVRALGAWPAGWRYPGAHRDPRSDAEVLRAIATTAERAHLDFLYFGDWLATASEFQFTDPYLLARIEPFAAAGYLAAITEQIGLVVTANTVYSQPYAVARAAASLDLLSGGRIGLNLTTGAEPRSAANFGDARVPSAVDRFESAAEYIEILRRLWDSWRDGSIVADAATGQFIDESLVAVASFEGRHHSVAGPLNVVRPPQGHLPIMLASSSTGARDLAAQHADLTLVAPATLDEAVRCFTESKARAEDAGREVQPVITSILPIVAATREKAWAIYDELVELVQADDVRALAPEGIPGTRTTRALAGVLGVSLTGVQLGEPVHARAAARFSELGSRLVSVVTQRSGRTIGGQRSITYQHLLVAHTVVAPIIVGSASDVADHLEQWFRARAVDGFTVLAPFLTAQFDDFVELVIPELVRRGLYRSEYDGSTLREHLGLGSARSSHSTAPLLTR